MVTVAPSTWALCATSGSVFCAAMASPKLAALISSGVKLAPQRAEGPPYAAAASVAGHASAAAREDEVPKPPTSSIAASRTNAPELDVLRRVTETAMPAMVAPAGMSKLNPVSTNNMLAPFAGRALVRLVSLPSTKSARATVEADHPVPVVPILTAAAGLSVTDSGSAACAGGATVQNITKTSATMLNFFIIAV